MMTEMVIADLAPVKSRAAFVGMIMGISGLGSMAGPAMAGAIVQYTTWRWVSRYALGQAPGRHGKNLLALDLLP